MTALIEAVQTEINLSQQPSNRLKYKVKKIERLDAARHLYQFHLDLGISIKLKVGSNFYDCEGIDYESTEEILMIRSQRTIFGEYGNIYLDTTFILKALIDKLSELMNNGFSADQPGRKSL